MASRPATDPRSVRLIRMVRLQLLFESAMYSAITPVLPHYARVLHAGKPALGLLAGAYSAGLIPGALLGGWLAARHGVRRTTVAGLAGFGVAIVAFGAGGDIVTLDLLRLAQGVGCGLIWGGGLTWVIAETPAGRRGAALAAAIGASTFGTLIGPLLGILAVSAGTLPVFAATGTVALGLAAWARRHPEPTRPPPESDPPVPLTRQLIAATRAGGFALGAWLTTLEGLLLGAAAVLVPLRLSHLGAPTWLIGATFLAVAALMSALSPLVGALVDRRGPAATVRVGLALGAPLVAVLALPPSALGLAGLAVIALGVPMTAGMIPAVSLMAAATERAGVALVLATTAVNVTYAVGETVGAPAAARLSQATGDTLPFALIAALMLLTFVAARTRRRPPAAQAPARASASRPAPGCATQGACPEPAGSRTGPSPQRSSPS